MIRFNPIGVIGSSLSGLISRPVPVETASLVPSPEAVRNSVHASGAFDLDAWPEAWTTQHLLQRASFWNFRRLALVRDDDMADDPLRQFQYIASLSDVFAAAGPSKASSSAMEKTFRKLGCDAETIRFIRNYTVERSKAVVEILDIKTRDERRRLAAEFLEIALHSRQEIGVCLFLAKRLGELSGLDWKGLVEERRARTSEYERELIVCVKDEGGCVPFDRFFDLAMFNPKAGTYTGTTAYHLISADPAASPNSFFTTAATDPILARSLLSNARGVWERTGGPAVFDLVEMGAGMGSLAEAILEEIDALPQDDRFGAAVRYTIVEKSQALARLQEDRLGRFGNRVAVLRRSAIFGALPRVPVGMFFSNELVDMFPPRKVVNAGGILHEVYMSHRGGIFQEICGPLRDETCDFLEARAIRPVPGETYYIQPDIDRWVASLAEALGSGEVVTIDYGEKRDVLRKNRHEFGRSMFRGYLRRSDPKIDFGLISYLSYRDSPTGVARPKDMTVDVDFTTLEEAVGKAGGLSQRAFLNQREFCLKYGGERPKLKGFDECWVSILSKGV
ncbi:MAG TPA: SAM-dependent methyltransferase [bacterium]|nr:SAM-dependent methyltransferase [bacterium]